MKKNKNVLYKRSLLFIIPILAGVIYLSGTVSPSAIRSRKSIVKVNNHTQSCEVLAVEKHNGHVKLSLRNDSNKNITAFVISSTMSPNDIFIFTEEFAYSEGDLVIAPGSIYEKIIGIPSDLNNQKIILLDLSAVIFDDKSSEGDPQVAQRITDERSAEKVQFEQLIPLLDKMLVLSNRELPIYFNERFKRDLATGLSEAERDLLIQLKKEKPQIMNRQGTDELPEQIQVGLHTGKESISYKVQELENIPKTRGRNALREEILRIKQIYEKIITRL